MLRRAPKSLLPATAIAATLALALAGCSSKSGGAEEFEEGPLDKYFSAMFDEEAYSEENMAALDAKVEDLVAVCMQKEGFEYKPRVQSSGTMIVGDDELDWGSKEFAEQYGYGTMTNPYQEQAEQEEPQIPSDPNEEYRSSLSPSEQQAYEEALYGAQPSDEELAELYESGEGYEQDPSDMGCYGTASTEVYADLNSAQAAYEDPEFAELFEELNSVYESVETDEGMTKLNSEWSSCMADAGFPDFKTKMDAQDSIWQQQEELTGGGEEPAEGAEPKPLTKKQTAELQKLEIETATADFECSDKLKYNKKTHEINIAIQQKFVDANKAKLDAMLAKYSVKSDSKSQEK